MKKKLEKLILTTLNGTVGDLPNVYNIETLTKHPLKLLELYRRGYVSNNYKLILSNLIDCYFFNQELNGRNHMMVEAIRISLKLRLPRVAYRIYNSIDIGKVSIQIYTPLLLELSESLFNSNSHIKAKAVFREADKLQPYSIHNLNLVNKIKVLLDKEVTDIDALYELTDRTPLPCCVLEAKKYPVFYDKITIPPQTDNYILGLNESILKKNKINNQNDTIYEVSNSSIVVKNGLTAILNKKNEIAINLSPPYSKLLLKTDIDAMDTLELDHLYLIHDRFYGPNYCHWILDVVPRLITMYRFANKKICIALSSIKTEFQRRTLELLSFAIDEVIELDKNPKLNCNKLFFLSSSWINHVHPAQGCNNTLLMETANTLKSSINMEGKHTDKRVYISRGKSSGRRIINESDFNKVLEKYNFSTYYLEDMSIEEQIELFHNADYVISPHGAGLTNLLFCNEGTKVLEIFNESYGTSAFHDLSYGMNLDYTCYNTTDKDQNNFSTKNNRNNILLDCNLIEKEWFSKIN